MSEHNLAGLIFKTNLEKHPEVFTINEEELNKTIAATTAKVQALHAKNDAEKNTAPELRKEYNQLRQKLFDLKQNAKCFEIRTNEAGGKIKLLEQRINDALRLKTTMAAADNLRGVHMYEHQVEALETELTDAQDEFNKNKHWSGQAARALKAFDGHGRIEELKAVLDSPKEKP